MFRMRLGLVIVDLSAMTPKWLEKSSKFFNVCNYFDGTGNENC